MLTRLMMIAILFAAMALPSRAAIVTFDVAFDTTGTDTDLPNELLLVGQFPNDIQGITFDVPPFAFLGIKGETLARRSAGLGVGTDELVNGADEIRFDGTGTAFQATTPLAFVRFKSLSVRPATQTSEIDTFVLRINSQSTTSDQQISGPGGRFIFNLDGSEKIITVTPEDAAANSAFRITQVVAELSYDLESGPAGVPEPSSLLALTLGCVGFGIRRMRKRGQTTDGR